MIPIEMSAGGHHGCLVCHYNEHPIEIENLKRIINLIQYDVDINKVNKLIRFNWDYYNNKCQYGTSCSKTYNFENTYRRLTDDLDYYLTAYIEQTDCQNYHEILNLLRGSFSEVYIQFEREIKIKK